MASDRAFAKFCASFGVSSVLEAISAKNSLLFIVIIGAFSDECSVKVVFFSSSYANIVERTKLQFAFILVDQYFAIDFW